MFRLLRAHAECCSPASRLLAMDTPSPPSPNWNVLCRATSVANDACRATCAPRSMSWSARTRWSPRLSHSLPYHELTHRPIADEALTTLRSDLPAHWLPRVLHGLSCTQGVVRGVVSGPPWCQNNRAPLNIEGAFDAATPVSGIWMPDMATGWFTNLFEGHGQVVDRRRAKHDGGSRK